MKNSTEKINRMHRSTFLFLLLLIVSIFSSCTVRKGIQASLEIPVTKQLNPSKAANNQLSTCHYVEAGSDFSLLISKTNSDTELSHQFADYIQQPKIGVSWFDPCSSSGWPLTIKIEHYILFRQMKSWIYS